MKRNLTEGEMTFTPEEQEAISALLKGDQRNACPADCHDEADDVDDKWEMAIGEARRLKCGDILVRVAEDHTPYSCGVECCGYADYAHYVLRRK